MESASLLDPSTEIARLQRRIAELEAALVSVRGSSELPKSDAAPAACLLPGNSSEREQKNELLAARGVVETTFEHRVKDAIEQHSEELELDVSRRNSELEALFNHLQDVAENERALIARELHDELAGTLSAIKVAQSVLANDLAATAGVPERLAGIQRLVDRALDATRNMIRRLRPPVLDHFGLLAALEWQAQEFSRASEIPCRLDLPDAGLDLDLALGKGRTLALFRIFQETLTNIAKHAHATEVVATLQAVDGVVTLRVSDNGSGLKIELAGKPGSFGIRGMMERARHLGGSLTLSAEPGKGTNAIARIPFAHDARKIHVLIADDHA